MRKILLAIASLVFAGSAHAARLPGDFLHRIQSAYVAPTGTCLYSSGVDDGCSALVAAGRLGVDTFNSVNNLGAGNSFFTYARQSGQGAYVNASYASTHPIPFNQPGGDYGIGNWTADGSLTLLVNNGVLDPPFVSATGCTYSASGNQAPEIVCDFTNATAVLHKLQGQAVKGTINSSGVFTLASGTLPPVGSYLYYATPEVGDPPADIPMPPYQVTATIDASDVQLASTPITGSGSSASPPTYSTVRNFTWSNPFTLAGYSIKDVWIYIKNGSGGVIDIHNNKIVEGVVGCRSSQNVIESQTPYQSGVVYGNFIGLARDGSGNLLCSEAAANYPTYGAVQASFNGTTTTQTPTFTGAISSGILTVSGLSGGVIEPGMIVSDGGVNVPAWTYVTAWGRTGDPYYGGTSGGTGTGGNGTYLVKTCTGSYAVAPSGRPSAGTAQTCTGAGAGTVAPETMSGQSFILTVNSGTAPSGGSYVAASGLSSLPSMQIVTSDGSGNYILAPSVSSIGSLSNVAMTTGPIQSTVGVAVSYSGVLGSAGFWWANYNYVDQIGDLFGANGSLTTASAKYNFVHSEIAPAQHGDPILLEQAQAPSGATTGSTWDIAGQVQSSNTVFMDQWSTSGWQYGDVLGIYALAGGTGGIASFPASSTAQSSTGYYINYTGLFDISNNILITNSSSNNYAFTPSPTNSQNIYITKQANYYLPAMPGGFQVSGNILDWASGQANKGSLGPWANTSCPTSTVGSANLPPSAPLSNINLYNGSTVVLSQSC